MIQYAKNYVNIHVQGMLHYVARGLWPRHWRHDTGLGHVHAYKCLESDSYQLYCKFYSIISNMCK